MDSMYGISLHYNVIGLGNMDTGICIPGNLDKGTDRIALHEV